MATGSKLHGGPKNRAKRYPYNESANEPGKLLDEEAVEIQHEIPAEETDPIEQSGPREKPAPPVFEE